MATVTQTETSTDRIIYDCNQRPYTVIAASPEDLKNLPGGLLLDRRILEHSDIWQNGLQPDLSHSRFQVFLVKDKVKVVGLTTLFTIPYKDLFNHGYLKLKNGIVKLTPLTKILKIQNPSTLVIECGFTQLLPAYRTKKLAVALLNKIIVPTALDLRKNFSGDFFLFCSAQGVQCLSSTHHIQSLWNQYLQGASCRETSVSMNELGKMAPQAKFTEKAAKSLGLQQLENAYNFRLGPVFARKI